MRSLKSKLYNEARCILRSLLPRDKFLVIKRLSWRSAWWLHRREISKVIDSLEDTYSKDTLLAFMELYKTGNPARLQKFTRPYDKMYFDDHLFGLKHDGSETFVDMGAYDMETCFQFVGRVENKYDCILSFEPDKASYEKAKENIEKKQLKRAMLFNEGCYDCDGEVSFSNQGSEMSYVSNVSEHPRVKVTSLDNKLRSLKEVDNITLIKMDIEGSEYKALQGCTETIRKYKPRLAVCLYHKPGDIYELPLLIKKILPEYKLYIRHYNLYDHLAVKNGGLADVMDTELVCYALI